MIKNYTSGKKTKNDGVSFTVDKIQKILLAHGVKQMSFEYDEQSKMKTLIFVIAINNKDFGFKLPARVEKVKALFDKQGYRYDPEQPYRTAWANIRDWIDAQMALIVTGQTKLEEVFLPYMVDSQGQTYFEHLQEKQFLLSSN